ncbi:hypothetical protein AW736_25290 [Termitidicoccus mucosus]|uniref:TonB-dependent receptor plug domain-containing protein n=2 Tax=Termitidicoccus mucosus TaxID=1184151 RepID=A0A178ID95_9BACT|nr:hypothetical protein AW736_25290 [Opitutaceae bacterium TSB47]
MIMLSPFQVDSTREKGYFAENTLAGSRMRTNISDLGAAITVVTKQQMEDTASLDVNDIFRYEIGTEGSTSYTPQAPSMSSNGIADPIAGASFGNSMTASTNATANRVRGLGSPSFALNYYQTISQVPFDSYNAASFEINRGPNSMLFGMGSPAGIVNQSTAQAQLNKNNAQVQVRVDDRGSNRASLSFNKSLIDDKLAIYGALLYDDKQFERKPSYDISRRQYGTITYKPFKKSTLRASIEGYNNDNRRANNLTPIDGVSEWRKAGKPYYNALTQEIISGATGQVLGILAPSIDSRNAQAVIDRAAAMLPNGYSDLTALKRSKDDPNKITDLQYNGVSIFGTGALTSMNSILYVPGITFQNGRATMQIADGALQQWYKGVDRQVTGFDSKGKTYAFRTGFDDDSSGTPYVYDNPVWGMMYDRSNSESTLWTRQNAYSGILNMKYDTVTDSSIYDWKHVNIFQMNFGRQRNTNYNIELEQEILPNLLHFSAGWFRQDFDSMQSYTVAQMTTATLYVDTNKYYPDGTPNPYFEKAYAVDLEPDRMEDSQEVDQYRAMIAFTPDFTQNNNWTKWLGRHQILGLASYVDDVRTTIRRRLEYADGSRDGKLRYMNNPNVAGWNMESTTVRRYFYLSDSGDTVNKASGTFDADIITDSIRSYDYTTGEWKDEEMTMIWNAFAIGTDRWARKLTSYSGAWNGYLWDDRIIATAGVRRDINRTRGVSNAGMTNAEKWVDGYYQYGEVFKRWNDWNRLAGTTSTMGAVVKPFLHWEPIHKRSGDNLFWELVENLGFSYNKSDNFDAPSTTAVDLAGNVLPKPVGDGKDYGVQFSLFKGKLYARLNWYEATNNNAIMENASMTLERLWWHIDSTAYRSWLSNIYMLNNGVDPLADSEWKTKAATYCEVSDTAIPANVQAMQAWVVQQWGLGDWDYYRNLGGVIRGTSSTKAKGVELTVNYNPLLNWTIKVTASKNKTTYGNVMPEYDAWIAVRKPQWDSANAADLLVPGVREKYAGGEVIGADGSRIRLTSFWDSYGYYDTNANGEKGGTTITATNTSGWTSSEGYYNTVMVPYALMSKSLEGQIAPGQREYSATVVTNYAFDRGALKGWSIGGAQRYASKTIIGYYGKASGANTIPDPDDPTKQKELLDMVDVGRPVYDDPVWYTDIWIAYTCKIFSDKVRMKLQLNVADVFQDGELKPVAVNYDGKPYAYRIVDPRTFILTATFDF